MEIFHLQQMLNNFNTEISAFSKGLPQSVLFMLRKKKFNITRRILKFSKLPSTEKKRSCHLKAVLKSLTDAQLDILLKCLQSKGGIESECIFYNDNNETDTHRYHHLPPQQPDVKSLMAQAFRFPDLSEECYLKCLVCCSSRDCSPGNEQCINPYHTSLFVDTSDLPLPPYTEAQPSPPPRDWPTGMWFGKPSDLSDSCGSRKSTASSMVGDEKFQQPWCRIIYWEMKNRIGPIFDASLPCINVFENLPQGNGLCLSMLNQGNINRTESSNKILQSIGYGFQLTKEEENVWLYNRSDIVLFVGSPSLQLESIDSITPIVKRIMPGHSIMVFNSLLSNVNDKQDVCTVDQQHSDEAPSIGHTPTDTSSSSIQTKQQPFCIRVSFGKGWGVNYTRMSITQCPCWVEIYVNL